MSRPDIHDAILSLSPGAAYTITDLSDLSTIVWADDADPPAEGQVHVGPIDVQPMEYKPDASEIEAELARMTSEWEAAEYARQRALAYPAVGDQLDALFHAGLFPDDMAAQLQAVKDQYPKSG